MDKAFLAEGKKHIDLHYVDKLKPYVLSDLGYTYFKNDDKLDLYCEIKYAPLLFICMLLQE